MLPALRPSWSVRVLGSGRASRGFPSALGDGSLSLPPYPPRALEPGAGGAQPTGQWREVRSRKTISLLPFYGAQWLERKL